MPVESSRIRVKMDSMMKGWGNEIMAPSYNVNLLQNGHQSLSKRSSSETFDDLFKEVASHIRGSFVKKKAFLF